MQFSSITKTKKILIATWGTRGDIQPLLGLAQGLRDTGYYVAIQANLYAKDIIEFYGFPFWSLSGDPEKLLSSPAFKESVENNDVSHYKESNEWVEAHMKLPEDILNVAQSFDLLIAHSLIWEQAYLIHKYLRIPLIGVAISPQFPTKKFKSPFASNDYFEFDSAKNFKSWELMAKERGRLAKNMYEKYIEEWGLSKIQSPLGWLWNFWYKDKIPIISAFSPQIIDGVPDDWPKNVHCIGYFDLLDIEHLRLDPNLEEWLHKEPDSKPLLITFGSMKILEQKFLLTLANSITRALGLRIIVLVDLAKFERVDPTFHDRIFFIKGASLRHLMPYCIGVVHHGGAGTTGVALRCGIPQIIISFICDQHFWGESVWKIGVGPKPLLYRKLRENELIEAIRVALRDQIVKKAEEISMLVKNEDSIKEAIKIVDFTFKAHEGRKKADNQIKQSENQKDQTFSMPEFVDESYKSRE